MAKKLQLEIVTPEERTFSGSVDMVVLPGVQGELGILPEHVPLITEIEPGELVITAEGKQDFLAVGHGFVEITGDHVWVVTDMALPEDRIDEESAEEAIRRAEAAMNAEDVGDEEQAAVEAALARSLAQLKVKRRRQQL